MSDETWTVLKILQWTTDYFISHQIETARLDAELLLSKILGLSRVQLYTQFDRPLGQEELKNFKALIQRRAKREPLAYLLGVKEFYSREFRVASGALIPRPETEMLIEEAIRFSQQQNKGLKIVDLGSGSGCIAITLALEIPDSQVWAVDLSEKTLEVLNANIEKYSLKERVHPVQADLFKEEWASSIAPFNLVVSNPPYIASDEIEKLAPEIQFEPRIALDGGKDGLDYYRHLIPWAYSHLTKGGIALFEIGFDQEKRILELLEKTQHKDFEIKLDLAGHSRIVKMVNSVFVD